MIDDNSISGTKITSATITGNKCDINTIDGSRLYSNMNDSAMICNVSGVKSFAKIELAYLSATGAKNSSTFLRGDNTFSTINTGSDITVSSVQFNSQNNFITTGVINTKTNIQIFGAITTGMIIENSYSESAGIYFSDDVVTTWNAGDQGSYHNWQDEDAPNSRMAYVDTSGNHVVVSSKLRKFSIKDKNNNDVLNRLKRLKVRSYGYRYDIDYKNDSQRRIERKIKKNKKMCMGFILEEINEVFNNCCGGTYKELDDNLIYDNDNIKGKKCNLKCRNIKDMTDEDRSNNGINYNNLLCYTIMAFQEYMIKQEEENKILKDNINNLNVQFQTLVIKFNKLSKFITLS